MDVFAKTAIVREVLAREVIAREVITRVLLLTNIYFASQSFNNFPQARWAHTERLKGVGYVQFEQQSSVIAAVKGDVSIDGRSLFVDVELGKPKNSFKTSDGRTWNKFGVGKKPKNEGYSGGKRGSGGPAKPRRFGGGR